MNLEDLPQKYQKQAKAKIKAQSDEKSRIDKYIEKGNKNAARQPQELIEVSQSNDSPRKYRNEVCEVNGIRFDSKKERRRYLELKGMYEAGLITELKLQHHFTLAEAFKLPDGTAIRRLEYIADFTYTDSDGKFIVEDVKSEITRKNPVYAIKKKLMAGEGYKITEV